MSTKIQLVYVCVDGLTQVDWLTSQGKDVPPEFLVAAGLPSDWKGPKRELEGMIAEMSEVGEDGTGGEGLCEGGGDGVALTRVGTDEVPAGCAIAAERQEEEEGRGRDGEEGVEEEQGGDGGQGVVKGKEEEGAQGGAREEGEGGQGIGGGEEEEDVTAAAAEPAAATPATAQMVEGPHDGSQPALSAAAIAAAGGGEEHGEDEQEAAAGEGEEHGRNEQAAAAGGEEHGENAQAAAAGEEEHGEDEKAAAAGGEEHGEDDKAAAATKVQACYRGHRARKEAAMQKQQEAAAATKLQACYRGHRARKEAAELQQGRKQDAPCTVNGELFAAFRFGACA